MRRSSFRLHCCGVVVCCGDLLARAEGKSSPRSSAPLRFSADDEHEQDVQGWAGRGGAGRGRAEGSRVGEGGGGGGRWAACVTGENRSCSIFFAV